MIFFAVGGVAILILVVIAAVLGSGLGGGGGGDPEGRGATELSTDCQDLLGGEISAAVDSQDVDRLKAVRAKMKECIRKAQQWADENEGRVSDAEINARLDAAGLRQIQMHIRTVNDEISKLTG